MRSTWRRLLAVGVGALLGLVALELVMQGVAYWLWQRTTAQWNAPGAAAEQAILCIGDSFTYGLGAEDSSGAYPSVLEAKLAQVAAGRFSVVNRSQPGQDSGRILRRLPHLLTTLRPSRVLLLVGYNDRWQLEPEVVDVGQGDPAGFPWRWRTLELLQRMLLWRGPEAGADRQETASFPRDVLGRWHAEGLEFQFEADGRAMLDGREFVWRVVAGEMRLGIDREREQTVAFRLEGDTLVLDCPWLQPATVRLRRGGLERDPKTRAQVAARDGQWSTVEALLAAHDPQGAWLGIRIALAAAKQDAATVEQGLAALRLAAATDPAQTSELVRVLLAIGHVDEAVVAATTRLDQDLTDTLVWVELLNLSQREPSWRPALLACVQRALDRSGVDDAWRWRLISTRAVLLDRMGEQPVTALTDALGAGLLLGHFHIAMDMLVRDPQRYSPAVTDQAIAGLTLTPDQARTIERVVHTARHEMGSAGARLERHLLRCAELCRQHHAELVLLTYPEPMPLDGAIERVAAAGHARLLDLRAVFAEQLRQRPWGELFVLDGHCNDAGYALMAEAVFRFLMG